MIVVNLFGAPGSGKSTGAAYIFARLKMIGVNAELVTEFAKDKVWEDAAEPFKNQAYLFGQQYYRVSRLQDKVDVVVTDSPILLSGFYADTKDPLYHEIDALTTRAFSLYNNFNAFIVRTKPYVESGRLHTEDQSNRLHGELSRFLRNHDVKYAEYTGDCAGYDLLIQDLLYAMTRSGIQHCSAPCTKLQSKKKE